MKVIFGQKNLEAHDPHEKLRIARVSGYFKRSMQLALVLVFIFSFWIGPYNIIKLHTPGEVSGTIETLDMWEESEYRHRGNKHYFIGITIDGAEYAVHMDYVDQDWLRLAGVVHDNLGNTATIKHIDDWVPLSSGRMIIDLEVDDEPLIDSNHLYDLWMKEAVRDGLTGLLVFALVLLVYLRICGYFRVIWK